MKLLPLWLIFFLLVEASRQEKEGEEKLVLGTRYSVPFKVWNSLVYVLSQGMQNIMHTVEQ